MDPIIGGALIQGGSSLLGGLLGMSGAQQANAQSAENARNMMEHQYFMSSTAHRREVDDLRAAGLNPILSVNAGASTTQGAMAPVQNTMEPMAEALQTAARDAMQFKAMMEKQKKEIELMGAQKEKIEKETKALGTSSELGELGGKAIQWLKDMLSHSAKGVSIQNSPFRTQPKSEQEKKDDQRILENMKKPVRPFGGMRFG